MFTSLSSVKIFKTFFVHFLMLVALCFVSGCSSKDAPTEEKPVYLDITLLDDLDNLVSDAKVYVFNDKANYEKTSAAYIAINANDSTRSDANGIAKIKIVNNQTLYLYIIKNEIVRNVVLTNEGQNNVINIASRNVNISIKIKLTPTNGNIAFYTFNNGVFYKIPIEITLSGVSFNLKKSLTLTDFAASVPTTVFETGVASHNSRFGTFKYQAKNADGCVWAGFVTLKRGEFLAVQLPKCERGKVNFSASTSVTDRPFPANISINGINVATLQNAVSSFEYVLEPGFYTYFIQPNQATTDCIWTGSFEITADQTTSVVLEKCK
ncbi:MAG: hypothetical protein EAZ53_01975 [Bacteroidetes bacterium]|nr:MAG: hypothetical protein EAZ53_01975 [Bacteroidota bacterium]